jgi:hypothetical protein
MLSRSERLFCEYEDHWTDRISVQAVPDFTASKHENKLRDALLASRLTITKAAGQEVKQHLRNFTETQTRITKPSSSLIKPAGHRILWDAPIMEAIAMFILTLNISALRRSAQIPGGITAIWRNYMTFQKAKALLELRGKISLGCH